MIYGVAVTCEFQGMETAAVLLRKLAGMSSFFSVKGVDIQGRKRGIEPVMPDTPMLPHEVRSPQVPALTRLDAPVIELSEEDLRVACGHGRSVLDGEFQLYRDDQESTVAPFFREQAGGNLNRILQISVNVHPVGTFIHFLSSSHVWLAESQANPIPSGAGRNLKRLADFVGQWCAASLTSLSGVVFDPQVKGPFAGELSRLSAAFAGLPHFRVE
jgi:hypothetical protein